MRGGEAENLETQRLWEKMEEKSKLLKIRQRARMLNHPTAQRG